MAAGSPPSDAADKTAAVPRRPWFEDRVDRLLLLLFFVGGFAAILAVKLMGRGLVSLGEEPVEPRFPAAILAGLLLALYALLASQTRTFRLHPDRLGDNCYYLGLLYTLASLSAALIELESAADARGSLIESLLASFGVALSSTILGIALRVWFVQMRREIDDLELELQRDLQQAAQKLKDQLLFAVTELESFRLRTQQVLHGRLEDSANAFAASAKCQAAAVEELARRAAASLAEALGPVGERLRAFDEAASAVATAGAELAGRIRSIEVPRDAVSAPARRLGDAVRRVEAAVGRLGASGEQLAAVFGAAASAGRAIEALGQAVTPAQHRFDELAAGLARLNSTLDQLTAAASDDATQIRGLRDQIRADLVNYHRAQSELMRTLVEIAQNVVRRLGG